MDGGGGGVYVGGKGEEVVGVVRGTGFPQWEQKIAPGFKDAPQFGQ